MIIKTKAPLRISFAGGGTDIEAFSKRYGGVVLNATIDLNSYCIFESNNEKKVVFKSLDYNLKWTSPAKSHFKLDGTLDLHKAIYNKMVYLYNNGRPLSIKVTSFSDAPPGSGLGSSSSLVVAIIKAYEKFLKIKLSKRKIAELSYSIEREDCSIDGGAQDQYAASFGGFNFMEFLRNGKVTVNSMNLKKETINNLESHLILYFTGISRKSKKIIHQQKYFINQKNTNIINALKKIKTHTIQMKRYLLKQKIYNMSSLLDQAWHQKKRTSDLIENKFIKKIHTFVMKNGALAAKISGAGGGGYMMIFVDPRKKYELKRKLENYNKKGRVYDFHFTSSGVENWIINEK